jgi:hypothetical protein
MPGCIKKGLRVANIYIYIYRALEMENKENKENVFSLLSEKVER